MVHQLIISGCLGMLLLPVNVFCLIVITLPVMNSPKAKRSSYRPRKRTKFKELLKSKLKVLFTTVTNVIQPAFCLIQRYMPTMEDCQRSPRTKNHRRQCKHHVRRHRPCPRSICHGRSTLATRDRVSRDHLSDLTVHTAGHPSEQRRLYFDSDSFDICIDNCASASITNSIKDFIDALRSTGQKIKGISGSTCAAKVGTVLWPMEDDQG